MKKILLGVAAAALFGIAWITDSIRDSHFQIPSNWHLISVTREEHSDVGTGYHLWFQDKDGSVYIVPAFQPIGKGFLFNGDIDRVGTTTNVMPQILPPNAE
jgi:hypothetical protein